MKSKLTWLVIILIVIAFIFSIVGKNNDVSNEEFKPLEINPGDEFIYIKYDNPMYVLNYMMEDVTGDTIKDMVFAIGEIASGENKNCNNIDIVIYEPVSTNFYNLNLKKFNGPIPKLYAYDLTGDGVVDIIAVAQNGDMSMRAVTYTGEMFKEIFKQKDNKGIVFNGYFLDGFKANIKNTKYNKEYNLDLKDRKENYIISQFYDEAGRLLKTDSKITTTGFTSVEFVQLDDFYGIETVQKVIGFDADDIIDEISTIWKYENGKWNIKQSSGLSVGKILY